MVPDLLQLHFPGGRTARQAAVSKDERAFASHPHIGHPIAELDIREYSIPRTPFSLIYRINGDTIEILRFWDERADRTKLGFGSQETPA